MADEEQVEILKQGVEVWNAWRISHSAAKVDLTGVSLSGVDLNRANFTGANLIGVDLAYANLSQAKLVNTNFNGANLSHTYLGGAILAFANFDSANLSSAKLEGAFLRCVNFLRTNFTKTILTQARLDHTTFADVDLSSALDLETALHSGPSTIGIDTLYRSKGKIPESFLRGCGVPDSLITYAESLIEAEKGIQFYSCFISYSTKDDDFARYLHGRLQKEHVRVWFAPVDLRSGQKLHEQIDKAIQDFDKLLIVLSPHSLKSEWVLTELRKARKRERQHGKRKLFPLRLVDYDTLRDWECFDADHGQDLATEVREYFIPDFSNWKDHDAFEAAFARLLKDLRETDSKAVG